MKTTAQRISCIFLCSIPFLDLVVGSLRVLRVAGLYQIIGVVLFAGILIAAWVLGSSVISSGATQRRRLALAGTLLILPWAIISLLWVGIGPPFQATAPENHMRYIVLLASTVIVTSAFIALKEELYEAGERFFSTVGFSASVTAGAAYLICISMSVASSVDGFSDKGSDAAGFLGALYSVLEFVACLLTYTTTAAFATSLGHVRWLGRGAARIYLIVSMGLVLLLIMRGMSFPELSGNTPPWYMRPGFIAGIPAIPWIMPCLLGVVLLRRAGEEQTVTGTV